MTVSWIQWHRRKWHILSAVVIATVALVSYYPSLDIGLWADDYAFFETAGRLSLSQYLWFYFDPHALVWNWKLWYRPIQGILWGFEYLLFGSEPFGYHVIQVLLHVSNALFLLAIASRLAQNWRVGFLAALVYASLPIYSLAVFWLGVVDPLASFFFLLTIWLWVDYLEKGGTRRWLYALFAFICALLAKEINVTLPVALWVVDRALIAKPVSSSDLLKRYAPIVLLLPLYALFEIPAATRGSLAEHFSPETLSNIFVVLFHHLGNLAFPWQLNSIFNNVATFAWLALISYAMVRRHIKWLAIATLALLPILPLLPFPLSTATAPRYLYLPLMVTCSALALLIDKVVQTFGSFRRAGALAASLLILAMVLTGSAVVSEDGLSFAGTARESRLQFRPIFQRHPNFAPDTFLYFVAPPFDSQYVSGLMFRRYGKNITVSGTDRNQVAALRDFSAAFVFYRDGEEWREWAVDKDYSAVAVPSLPIKFDDVIAFDGFELTSVRIKRGETTMLFLYWRGLRAMEKDYRVYVHLVDAQGTRVAGFDHQPQDENAPTSSWKQNNLVVDWVIISTSNDLDPGMYRLEIGWYDAQTGARLSVTKDGQRTGEMIMIEPVEVVK